MKLDMGDPTLKLIALAKDRKTLIKLIVLLMRKKAPLDYIRTALNKVNQL